MGHFHPTMPPIIMSLVTTKIGSDPISILKDLPSDQPIGIANKNQEGREGGRERGREKEGQSHKEGINVLKMPQ